MILLQEVKVRLRFKLRKKHDVYFMLESIAILNTYGQSFLSNHVIVYSKLKKQNYIGDCGLIYWRR